MVLFLFRGVFEPNNVMFSNDGPLGRLMSECHHLPERFTGCWQDLNIAGFREGSALPNLSFALQWLLKPVWFSKLYAPLALVFLGLAAWTFFYQLKLAPPACILGAVAATLNSAFFSAACWGIAAHTLTVGFAFFALAALADASSQRTWLWVALAGFAVGMGVAEGADVGALFSLLVAAYVIYATWTSGGPAAQRLATGAGRLLLVACCAGFLAVDAISDLVAYNVKGVSGARQDATTKAGHWNWATQWSLPKREALGFVMPGLFGYLADTPDGGVYWGAVGRDAEWEQYLREPSQGPPPNGKFVRFAGGGFYAGIPVVLVAFWAAVQSSRRRNSVFNFAQRRTMWFWIGISLVALAFAFGRHAPFYRLLYGLPYFSTVRNPVKFVDLVGFSLVVLFAHGVDGIWRGFLRQNERVRAMPESSSDHPGSRFDSFEKKWIIGCGVVVILSLVGWLVYFSYRPSLEQYLQTVQFNETAAAAIAAFSIRQVGWFVLFFVFAAGLLASIFAGAFTGAKATPGCVLLGLLVAIDLARANQPWITYRDYKEENASNVIIDAFRNKPWEHRVAFLPYRAQAAPTLFEQTYTTLWLQHQFPCYNIQSLDVWQMPRKPADIEAFERALSSAPVRRWQLTNTRYLLGSADFLGYFNESVDPVQHRLRLVQRLDFVIKPGIGEPTRLDQFTPALNRDGTFAIYELTGVLPRAKLYSQWQTVASAQSALDQLTSPAFDLEQSVLVTTDASLPLSATGTSQGQSPGEVTIESYASKKVRLSASPGAPSVLLLNDRYDPHWKVLVDDKPAALLRCNYLMRGVFLSPGFHTIEFRFQPSLWPFRSSLVALGAGVLLLGFLVVPSIRKSS
jgi:hypothetical protein